MYTLGRKQCCKLHYTFLKVSIKLRLPFSNPNVFFVSKRNLSDVYYIVSGTLVQPSLYKR